MAAIWTQIRGAAMAIMIRGYAVRPFGGIIQYFMGGLAEWGDHDNLRLHSGEFHFVELREKGRMNLRLMLRPLVELL